MSTATKLSCLFSVLHDGAIASAKGKETHLTLRVECQYLAELFHPDFYFFYVELIGVSEFTFMPWQESALATAGVAALTIILEADLEIVSAQTLDNKTVISLLNSSPTATSGSGDLTISCLEVNLFDQGKSPLSLKMLQEVASTYWGQWNQKNQ